MKVVTVNSFCALGLLLIALASPVASQRGQTRTNPRDNALRFGSSNATHDYASSGDSILARLYDRIAGIMDVDEQILKRLEALEYKITRVEVSNQDRYDAIRAEVRELSRRYQNVDWILTKAEGSIEELKGEWDAVKGNLYQVRDGGPVTSGEFSDKLNSLATLLTSTRQAVARVEKELISSGLNITHLQSHLKEVSLAQRNLPTKAFLNSALLGLKSHPVYAVMQPGSARSAAEASCELSVLPSSCREAQRKSGIIRVEPSGFNRNPFYVNCLEGWTVIQHRDDGGVNFYRTWQEYRHGFGNLDGEFWIGLDKLHQLTATRVHELLIHLEDFEGERRVAQYDAFAIGGEKEHFALMLLGKYTGDAGDSLSYHAGQKFSALDMDNDSWVEGNCAQAHTGGWWYNACDTSNLNGRYLGGEVPDELRYQGIYWNDFKGANYSLRKVRMMIRPVE
ncbi:microfibril-associated glycoprotein 4 [Phlebotomus argentipes]|uniref:microfibril-associated glycoprotein 4 n=1 Tax=Phlebotomus argentipes TaxID=94469 RepID=UPI002892CCCF|nr:microfibril-associated glycoprotein 4 [Phlebotomus argentipes]